jgi:hypothetical protein
MRFSPPKTGARKISENIICHMKPLAVGADSVCDHGIGHAVAYSTSFIQKFIAILTTLGVRFALRRVAVLGDSG